MMYRKCEVCSRVTHGGPRARCLCGRYYGPRLRFGLDMDRRAAISSGWIADPRPPVTNPLATTQEAA